MERRSLLIRSIWAACLLIAAANHARILLRHGLFWHYGDVPWPSAVYWTSLTFLDPLAVALLFLRPKLGILATATLIATNVTHNLALTAHYAPAGEFLNHAANPLMASQVAFLLFVAVTAHAAWKGAPNRRSRAG